MHGWDDSTKCDSDFNNPKHGMCLCFPANSYQPVRETCWFGFWMMSNPWWLVSSYSIVLFWTYQYKALYKRGYWLLTIHICLYSLSYIRKPYNPLPELLKSLFIMNKFDQTDNSLQFNRKCWQAQKIGALDCKSLNEKQQVNMKTRQMVCRSRNTQTTPLTPQKFYAKWNICKVSET